MLGHAQCEQDLGMRVPQILKVKDTCSYVAVGFACGSLGQDFIDMLDRASKYVTGNPALGAANRLIAETLLTLIRSPTPVRVHAFREAAKVDEGSDGAHPRDVLLKVLQALKRKDQKRFSVMIDLAFVCPHCGRHESTTRSVPRPFFDYHRQDYDYTEPWVDVCGRPFDGLGTARNTRGPPREDRCRKCKEPLRSTRQDETLDVKEKLQRPHRPGTPEEPQYVVVFYECPPAIVKNGVRMADVDKLKDMKACYLALVRPHLEQRFGAFRVSPWARVKPGTVFDTGHQRVFHLVGYAPILPVRFDHVAWRTHNLEKLRFIHSEVNLRYFRMGQQDYLRDQHICFAIYRSAGERVSQQPPQYEEKWDDLEKGYATHKASDRTEKEAPERVTTRSQASKTAQGIDQPGPSGLQQQVATAESNAQPGPSGQQPQAQKVAKAAQKKTAKRGKQ
ncbi:hypothetical protein AAVH_25227 [Aphelenchoides avenae]|nr:hypothetical protein AAVH_25227 [Aphelenchus avenae]